jgi:tRNA threonylcarbamoyladenosine biosynthesis protein TsaB
MKILTLRTDKPEAELGLYDDNKQVAYLKWPAHRELADTIHKQLKEMLDESIISLNDIQGIVCFKGPGSFTGLRIGLSVANALAYSQNLPIIASSGEQWLEQGVKRLLSGQNDKVAIPEYGAPANTTSPRK